MSAIWGTAESRGVSGAGADTARDSAATVTGGEEWGTSLSFEKPLGSGMAVGFSPGLLASLSFCVSLDLRGGADVRENGNDEIGASLAFTVSKANGAVYKRVSRCHV